MQSSIISIHMMPELSDDYYNYNMSLKENYYILINIFLLLLLCLLWISAMKLPRDLFTLSEQQKRKGYRVNKNQREKQVQMERKCGEERLLTFRRASFRSTRRPASVSRGYPRVPITSAYHLERTSWTIPTYTKIHFREKVSRNALQGERGCILRLLTFD